MESHYNYFNRDISWLSFNHRVLLEADDDTLPLFERINFIAIYSSNLEEFYQVRVAEHKAVASGGKSEDMTVDEAHALIRQITDTVNRQLEDRVRIYEEKILPALRRNHVVFYQSKSEVEDFHKEFVHRFFMEEVFPYIQPVKIDPENVRFFLRDRRLYLAVKVWKDAQKKPEYYIIKMPYSKVPRFVQLPSHEGNYYLMFLEDIIKANLKEVFIGYEVECSYCCKISRDADVFVDDVPAESMVEKLKEKVKKRKIGAICRFVYDRKMPDDFLDALVEALGINREELVPGDKHLNLEDLASLPNPNPDIPAIVKPQPMFLPGMNEKHFMYRRIAKRDMLLYYPYHSFEHFIHFLYEAVHDPFCREIMITQYRVAEHSEVINALIAAARNGKHVTVFVELKEFRMSAIPLVIIIAREFMVSGLRLLAAEEGVVIAAGIWGKLKTAFTMVTIVGVMAYLSLAYDFGLAVPDFVKTWILGALIWISTALTIISGLVYLKGCWKYIDGDK